MFSWSQISMAIANKVAWQYHCPPWLCRITFRWKNGRHAAGWNLQRCSLSYHVLNKHRVVDMTHIQQHPRACLAAAIRQVWGIGIQFILTHNVHLCWPQRAWSCQSWWPICDTNLQYVILKIPWVLWSHYITVLTAMPKMSGNHFSKDYENGRTKGPTRGRHDSH